MKAQSPLAAVNQFVDAMNRGDLQAAVAMYESQAVLIAQPGVVARGRPALREALAGMLALKPVLTTQAYEIFEADDIALYCARWSMHGTDPAGKPVQESGRSADVLRRQADGSWLIALDNPFGPDLVV